MAPEDVLRPFGGVLQLVGLLIVGFEFHKAYCRYRGRKNWWERVWQPISRWLSKGYHRLFTTPRNITGVIHSAIELDTAMAVGVVTGGRGYDSFTTQEELNRYLFERDKQKSEQLKRIQERHDEQRQETNRRFEESERLTNERLEQMNRAIMALEAGNVQSWTHGFICVTFGTIFATWSVELHKTDFAFWLGVIWFCLVMATMSLEEVASK